MLLVFPGIAAGRPVLRLVDGLLRGGKVVLSAAGAVLVLGDDMLELDGDASVVVGTLFDVADLGFLGGDVLVGERHLVAELDEYALGIVFVGLIVETAYLGIGLADDVFFAVYFEGDVYKRQSMPRSRCLPSRSI